MCPSNKRVEGRKKADGRVRAPSTIEEAGKRLTGHPPDAFRKTIEGEALLRWFEAHKRDLPWRRTSDPYRIWVSEIMLQQTQVAKVRPYYQRFLEHFPTLAALARADLDDVLRLWRGLGYYSRARNLHKGARYIVETYDGRFPRDKSVLLRVPGIGAYTAGAILSIAFGQRVSLLDGNVARVLSRFFGLEIAADSSLGRRTLWALADAIVPLERPGDHNQSLMELGATLCAPRRAACPPCPLQTGCWAARLPDPTTLPVKSVKKKRPRCEAIMIVLRRPSDGHLLFGQRPGKGLLAGLWEPPTGLIRASESPDEACARVLKTRLGSNLPGQAPSVTIEHIYTHFHLVLHACLLDVDFDSGMSPTNPVPIDVKDVPPTSATAAIGKGVRALDTDYVAWQWIAPDALPTHPMGKATIKALQALGFTCEHTTSQLRLFARHHV